MNRNNLGNLRWIVISLLLITIFTVPAYAASQITVTTTDDLIADDADCSLREAIIAANTDSAFGGCNAGSGSDTIVLAATLSNPATFVLTTSGSNENNAQSGDLDILSTITISGTSTSAQVVIDGNGTDRVFEVHPQANLTLLGVTIRNGNPGATAHGGGILVNLTGRLTLNNAQVINNSAQNGGGIYVLGRLTMSNSSIAHNQGGGLDNEGGLVTLNAVQAFDNQTQYAIINTLQGFLTFTDGAVSANSNGGVFNNGATATLTRITIEKNLVGGGVVNIGTSRSEITVISSQIISNSSNSGAGLLNEGIGAVATLFTSRISGNQATGDGGGLFNNSVMGINESTIDHNQARAGAGIYHLGGNLSLVNVTVNQNSAQDNGGGLYNGASAVLNNVTLHENSAGGNGGNLFNDETQLGISNSIVTNAQSGGNCSVSGGSITSNGHNLESANSCSFNKPGDIINSDPKLGSLQDNGGPTFTLALLTGSPAIDAGNGQSCAKNDQRGLTRPQGAGCDIGAFEVGTLPPPTATKTPTSTPTATKIATPRPTATFTPTATNTTIPPTVPTQTPGGTLPATPTVDPALTATPVATLAQTPTADPALTTTPSATPIETLPATATVDPTPAASPTATDETEEVEIEIEPPLPNSSEAFSITISGESQSSCTPHYKSHEVNEEIIAIQSAPSTATGCLNSEFEWSYSISVGPLAAGNYTVTHTLAANTVSKQLTVVEYNPEAPEFSDDSNEYEAEAGEPFDIQIDARSALTTTYALVQAPAGMTIDPETGKISWQPDAMQSGEIIVIVSATNQFGVDQSRLRITVNPAANMHHTFLPLVKR